MYRGMHGAHDGECSCVAVPPRGANTRRTDTFIATAGWDEVVRLWDLRSVSSNPGLGAAQSMATLGGGLGGDAGSSSGQVRVSPLAVGTGHSKRINDLCFNRTGSQIVDG